MIVTLSSAEMFIGAMIGVRRHIMQLKSTQRNKVKNPAFGWHSDIEGACAELAYAKASGQYWSNMLTDWKNGDAAEFKQPDVGTAQIRHTELEDGCLIVRPTDCDQSVFVLVVGKAPRFRVCGSIQGSDAKVTENWREDVYAPAWFVPQGKLREIDERKLRHL